MNTRLCSFLAVLLAVSAQAREWTSSDGRKLQADFVSVSGADVIMKSPGGQPLKVPLARLSPADQAWVKDQTGKPAVPGKKIEGPFASLITGDWTLSKHKN